MGGISVILTSPKNALKNIDILQIVPELRVDAQIHESRELAVLRVLGMRSGQEIDPLEGQSGNFIFFIFEKICDLSLKFLICYF